jgi:hypothetical protein
VGADARNRVLSFSALKFLEFKELNLANPTNLGNSENAEFSRPLTMGIFLVLNLHPVDFQALNLAGVPDQKHFERDPDPDL